MNELSPAFRLEIERIVTARLADWPPEWQGFHWPGYTLEHTFRVRRLALALAAREGADLLIVELAALLHDIAKPAGAEHAEIGAQAADEILARLGLAPALRAPITQAIALHAGKNTPAAPLESRLLGDADLIDANFGYVATWRFLTIRAGHGWALADTISAMREWLPKKEALLSGLLTAAGSICAQERFHAMRSFCALIEAAFQDNQMLGGVRELIADIVADYERASLVAQLPRLRAKAQGDRTAAAICWRLEDEMEGHC